MNRRIFVALGAAIVMAAAGAGWLLTQPGTAPGITEFAAPAIAQDASGEEMPEVVDMSMGNPDAAVTVIEYASYTCPHCGTFHQSVLKDLKKNYIDTGKINFIYREVYFDKYGLWAGMVARCAGPEKYFAISNMIYENQANWLASRNDAGIASDLRKLGLTAGVEPDQLDACFSDGAMAQALVAEFQKNATADGIDSTPSFVINGKKYSNMNYADFSGILDDLLGE